MTLFALLNATAAAWRLARTRRHTRRAIEALPDHLRKDIGYRRG